MNRRNRIGPDEHHVAVGSDEGRVAFLGARFHNANGNEHEKRNGHWDYIGVSAEVRFGSKRGIRVEGFGCRAYRFRYLGF